MDMIKVYSISSFFLFWHYKITGTYYLALFWVKWIVKFDNHNFWKFDLSFSKRYVDFFFPNLSWFVHAWMSELYWIAARQLICLEVNNWNVIISDCETPSCRKRK